MAESKKYGVIFLLGSIGYGAIEILWRGYTHWSMLLAGGVCFMIFLLINKVFFDSSLILRAFLCGTAVTCVEFFFGVLFNLILKMNVWDYSTMPFNVLGQVCAEFYLMWIFLGLIFTPLAGALDKLMS